MAFQLLKTTKNWHCGNKDVAQRGNGYQHKSVPKMHTVVFKAMALCVYEALDLCKSKKTKTHKLRLYFNKRSHGFTKWK